MKAIVEDLRNKLCHKKQLTFRDLKEGEWYELAEGTNAGPRMKLAFKLAAAVKGDVVVADSGEVQEGAFYTNTVSVDLPVRRLKVRIVIEGEEKE